MENPRGASNKVYALETLTGKWQTQPLPDLKVRRFDHLSISIDHHVFVACGETKGGKPLGSIEMLSMSGDVPAL